MRKRDEEGKLEKVAIFGKKTTKRILYIVLSKFLQRGRKMCTAVCMQ